MTITPEIRSELLTMFRQEMEQEERRKKENRTVYQRVCREFEEEFTAFDYEKQQDIHSVDGNVYKHVDKHLMAYHVKTAIGVLLRAIYQADGVAKLTAEKEQDMQKFVGDVLSLMKQTKEEVQ